MSELDEGIEWDEAAFSEALRRSSEEGIIDADGVRLSADQLRRLIEAAPEDPERPGQRRVSVANFGAATFSGVANFNGATLGGNADFNGATFSGGATFHGATFSGVANFNRARFGGLAVFGEARFSRTPHFGGATFSGDAMFDEATFSGSANFSGATFGEDAVFTGATVSGAAAFGGTTLTGDAFFDEATFSEDAMFHEATFSGSAYFSGATFGEDATFAGATVSGAAAFGATTVGGNAYFQRVTFEQARQLGPLLVCGRAFLHEAVFAQPVRIELSSRILSCARTVFRGGADLFVRWADVSLEEADFAAPSLVAELRPLDPSDGERAFLGWDEAADDGTWRCRLGAPPDQFAPRVLSLRRAKIAQLTVAGVDLRVCRFLGAHGLAGLTLDRVQFASPPDGWQRGRRWRRMRWTRRQTIAEERHWREGHDCGSGWYEEDARAPDWLTDTSQPPDAAQVAGIYRALRKGREDSKDEPGAPDQAHPSGGLGLARRRHGYGFRLTVPVIDRSRGFESRRRSR